MGAEQVRRAAGEGRPRGASRSAQHRAPCALTTAGWRSPACRTARRSAPCGEPAGAAPRRPAASRTTSSGRKRGVPGGGGARHLHPRRAAQASAARSRRRLPAAWCATQHWARSRTGQAYLARRSGRADLALSSRLALGQVGAHPGRVLGRDQALALCVRRGMHAQASRARRHSWAAATTRRRRVPLDERTTGGDTHQKLDAVLLGLNRVVWPIWTSPTAWRARIRAHRAGDPAGSPAAHRPFGSS